MNSCESKLSFHYSSLQSVSHDPSEIILICWFAQETFLTEPILTLRKVRKLRRAPETPGGPLALKDDFILV